MGLKFLASENSYSCFGDCNFLASKIQTYFGSLKFPLGLQMVVLFLFFAPIVCVVSVFVIGLFFAVLFSSSACILPGDKMRLTPFSLLPLLSLLSPLLYISSFSVSLLDYLCITFTLHFSVAGGNHCNNPLTILAFIVLPIILSSTS